LKRKFIEMPRHSLELLFRSILVAVFIAVSAGTVQSQKKSFIRSADEAFDDERYTLAIEKYQKALTKVKKDPLEKDRIAFRLAESYRLTGDMKRAEVQYKRLIKNGYDSKEPTILLHYANNLRTEGTLDEAKVYYEQYQKKMPDDPRGAHGIEACEKIPQWTEFESKYEIAEVKGLNSRESDFAPAYANENFNGLIFTSTREGSKGKGTDEWTNQSFSSLFTARQDVKGEWSTPVLIDDAEKDGVNSEANEGAPTMSSDFGTLYFTRCPNEEGKKNGCQIYTSRRTGRFWSKPELISLGFDSTEAIGHPTLSNDELVIYFSSNREGGMGGKDIWVSWRESVAQPFGRAYNLGPVVNTPGDEMFPFLRNDTLLYFASDGHPGVGGLDIFYTTVDTSNMWIKPVNIGIPINGPADDFAIIFQPEGEQGYFSTNRSGRKSREDIYSFIIPPVIYTLSGTVKDDRTLQMIPGARVDIVGSDGVSMTARTADNGVYMFGKTQIMPNTTYEITVSKDNYFNSSGKVTTVGYEKSKDLTRDFILEPIPEEPVVLPEILYDLAKWDLKPQYQDSLQGLITTLEENPTLVIELASHTDARDTYERNDVLSQRRAQSVVDYLIERGIDADRLVAKGYGERVPRKLLKDIVRDGFLFPTGTVLTESYIDSLSTTPHKEAAHQLNRRTEFRVLSKDFVPKPKNVDIARTVEIQINPDDNVLKYELAAKSGLITAPCIMNGYTAQFTLDPKLRAQISVDEALKLLANGAIGKNDFQGNPEEILAGGTVANRAILIIKEFTIANKTVSNVEFMVTSNLAYPVVIGNSVLSSFGEYTVDTQQQRIIFRNR
jgi:peptidoglycan-associated lipoprotein